MFLRLFSVSSFAAAQVALMYGYVQFTQRLITGIRATRYICISAPSYLFPPIDIITQKLNPSRVVIERCQQCFARQLGATWDDLKTGKSFDGAGPDLLLFCDETDRMVSHREGDKIFARCPLPRRRACQDQRIRSSKYPDCARACGTYHCIFGDASRVTAIRGLAVEITSRQVLIRPSLAGRRFVGKPIHYPTQGNVFAMHNRGGDDCVVVAVARVDCARRQRKRCSVYAPRFVRERTDEEPIHR